VAYKSNGVCGVCRATRQLHLKDGTVHKHGPRTRPCAGSHKPPRDVSNLSRGNRDHTATAAAAVPSDDSASVSDATDLWAPDECTVIKHIPKSPPPACALHLAELLRAIVAQLK